MADYIQRVIRLTCQSRVVRLGTVGARAKHIRWMASLDPFQYCLQCISCRTTVFRLTFRFQFAISNFLFHIFATQSSFVLQEPANAKSFQIDSNHSLTITLLLMELSIGTNHSIVSNFHSRFKSPFIWFFFFNFIELAKPIVQQSNDHFLRNSMKLAKFFFCSRASFQSNNYLFSDV